MFTTNNTILLKHTENLPPIYCIQRKGNKVVPTETDMIQANKGSFGDAIGPITNAYRQGSRKTVRNIKS